MPSSRWINEWTFGVWFACGLCWVVAVSYADDLWRREHTFCTPSEAARLGLASDVLLCLSITHALVGAVVFRRLGSGVYLLAAMLIVWSFIACSGIGT
jgi:hypothetical protein